MRKLEVGAKAESVDGTGILVTHKLVFKAAVFIHRFASHVDTFDEGRDVISDVVAKGKVQGASRVVVHRLAGWTVKDKAAKIAAIVLR